MKLTAIVMMTLFSLSGWAAGDSINYTFTSEQEEMQTIFLGEDDTPALGDTIGYNVIHPEADSNTRKTASKDESHAALGDFIQY